jgi:hypothetical protein
VPRGELFVLLLVSTLTFIQVINRTHVNLFDLIEADRTRTLVPVPLVFKTEKALAEYTTEHGMYFPRTNEVAGGLLKYMLRQILNPRSESSKRGGRPRLRPRH